MDHQPAPDAANPAASYVRDFVSGAYTAANIIERRGQDAVVVTAERADKLLGEGDKEGATVLWKIMDAIEEQLRRRRAEEHLN